MNRLLDSIEGPEDLRRLGEADLEELAGQVRSLILEVVSARGGHLASNLGVVELTIALHYCFDFLRDRLIWDVSHQCYAHKILTGRRDSFQTLRQAGGMSGFTNTAESPYDLFNFGHTGTSVSAGLGLACALGARGPGGGDAPRVVAVIGDGAIASGMPFEAMNHAAELGVDLLLVLNDNEMSISPSVGGIARYLNKVRASAPYLGVKQEFHNLLSRWPHAQEGLEGLLTRVADGLQTTLTPGGLFVELGFNYFGPVNGHDLGELIATFRDLRRRRGPVLLHVLTEKGRGFPPASDDPRRFHSSGRFQVRDGKVLGRTPPAASEEQQSGIAPRARSYSQVVGEALTELAEHDERITAVTAAMPDGTGLAAFGERFPDRLHDVGICEQHGAGFAGGLAAGGMRPVLCIYSTFLQRAFDQVFHDIALQRAPVVICVDRAGLVGSDGATHHGCYDLALFLSMPDFVVMAPRDDGELRAMLRLALEQDCPCAIRYPKEAPPPPLAGAQEELELGRADVLRRGIDGAIIAYGSMVRRAMDAAEELAERDGKDVAVINARFAKPLDEETILNTVEEHGAVLVAEEHAPAGGCAAAVLGMLAERGVPIRHVRRAGLPDEFVPHATRDAQLAALRLDGPGLAERLRELMAAL